MRQEGHSDWSLPVWPVHHPLWWLWQDVHPQMQVLVEIFTSADHTTLTLHRRWLTMLPPRPIKQAKSSPALAPAELPPQPSPAKPQGCPPPAVIAPDHTGPSPKQCAPQPPPSNKTPPPLLRILWRLWAQVKHPLTTLCPALPQIHQCRWAQVHLQHGRRNLP